MRWGWWRGKLTKTAMEKMKPWDKEEITRREQQAHFKCRKELDKVDWKMMKKHLRTPEALQAYEKLCNDARNRITQQVTELISKRKPDVRLQYYYGKFAYLPFKERLLSNGVMRWDSFGGGILWRRNCLKDVACKQEIRGGCSWRSKCRCGGFRCCEMFWECE